MARRITWSMSVTSFSSGSSGTLVNHFGGNRSEATPLDSCPSTLVSSWTNTIGTSVMVAMPYLNGIRVLS